ncbi:MAG: ABC transporter permease [Acidobacteria bacterium]|nr:ABC transporter permease [Acidobacteriota bacterium]
MRALRYCFDEATASLWRGRGASLLSILTIAIALFVLSGFLVVAANLERQIAQWSDAAELSVYLADDISQDQRLAVDRILAGHDSVVAAREYLSKADALRRFKRDFPDLAGTADGLSSNPFPASFEVRLRGAQSGGDAADRLAAELRQTLGVVDVRYDRQWIQRLSGVAVFCRVTAYVLGGILVGAAVLTVTSVVRLALYGRQDEIKIMELVGAPIGYIRGPFVLEGTLQGGIGAGLALAALWGGVLLVRTRGPQLLEGLADLSTTTFLPPSLAALLVAGGMLVGCVGGFIAARTAR